LQCNASCTKSLLYRMHYSASDNLKMEKFGPCGPQLMLATREFITVTAAQ
jgi:hypothetical protein